MAVVQCSVKCKAIPVTGHGSPQVGFLRGTSIIHIQNSKAIIVTGHGGLLGCEMLRIPHCLENRLTDGGEVVSLTQWPHSTPQKYFLFVSGTHICYRLA
jgi:hypothetical protein